MKQNTYTTTLDKVAQQIKEKEEIPVELQEASALLVFLWALATVNWRLSYALFEQLLPHRHYSTPIWGGLLAHLVRLGPEPEAQALKKRCLPVLLQQHLQLAEAFDPQQEGLLYAPSLEASEAVISPLLQTFWVWSNHAIIEFASENALGVGSLILLQELGIFEINAKLWISASSSYGQFNLEKQVLTPSDNFVGFLPLFASIPDQDRAEQMYLQLKALGLPLEETRTITPPSLPPATAFMLYVGLLEFDMAAAARQLKKYYLNTAQANDPLLVHQALALLWDKY